MTQFIDLVQIEVTSGDGGNGVIGWRREKYEPSGGPAGGAGGRGGSVYIEASPHLSTLSEFKYKNKFLAASGNRGGGGNKDGKSGKDLVLKVPMGTVIKDAASDQVIADLEHNGDRIMIAAGGRGGRGNSSFAIPSMRSPYFCEPGETGVNRKLTLELKLLADVGLMGLPNAGKSTLLAALTSAKPKIAAYPFSTLEPNLGTVVTESGPAFVIADIPGLIEGASEGVGLGHDFLRHIERTRMLVHVVDASSENIENDIKTIDKEIEEFSLDLSAKDQIIALNKIDMLSIDETEVIKNQIKKIIGKRELIAVSGLTRQGIKELFGYLTKHFAIEPIESLEQEPKTEGRLLPSDEGAIPRSDGGFEISRHKGCFYVTGDRVLRHAQVVDGKSPESIQHFAKILRSMGIIDELNKQQIKVGDKVQIGEMSFSFGEELY